MKYFITFLICIIGTFINSYVGGDMLIYILGFVFGGLAQIPLNIA